MRSNVLWIVAGMFLASMLMAPVVITARPAVPTQPAVVATIDLEKVFMDLNRKKAADAELNTYARQLEAEQVEIRAKIERLSEELGGLAPSSAAYQAKQHEHYKETFNYQALIELNRSKLERKKGLTMRTIYLEIKAAAKTLCEERGLDIIMLDDSIVDIEIGNEAEVSRQISARRTLHCNPEIDVTQELIARMNR